MRPRNVTIDERMKKVSSQVRVLPVYKGQANQMGYKTLGAGG